MFTVREILATFVLTLGVNNVNFNENNYKKNHNTNHVLPKRTNNATKKHEKQLSVSFVMKNQRLQHDKCIIPTLILNKITKKLQHVFNSDFFLFHLLLNSICLILLMD